MPLSPVVDQCVPIDPRIVGFAQLAILTLRQNGIPDAEILDFYTQPSPRADRFFELAQIASEGTVIASAHQVKRAMRLLLESAAAAA